MSMGYEIGDYRFEGYTNEQLAVTVDQVRQGPSEMMQTAFDALTIWRVRATGSSSAGQ